MGGVGWGGGGGAGAIENKSTSASNYVILLYFFKHQNLFFLIISENSPTRAHPAQWGHLEIFFKVRTVGPKLGYYPPFFFQNITFLMLYISARKKPQQWSLNEVIENILPFISNTKPPLRDI